MQGIALIISVSILVEGLTQYIKEIISSEREVKVANIISLIAGVGLSFIFQAQLFAALGLEVAYPVIDTILTGLVLSRGSNYVHDLISRMGGERINTTEVITKTETDLS